MEEPVVKFYVEDQVARIVVHRPKALNALNADVLQSLIQSFQKIEQEKRCRVVVLSGEGGKAFVAGADISSMSSLGPRAIADYVELGQRCMRAIERCRLPVIAAIDGYALGGGLELALACDLICATKSSKVGQPEVNLGIIPGFGGTQRLIARAGLGVARRLVLSGEIIGAEEAFQLGLVDWLFDQEGFFDGVMEKAMLIASKAPLAVQGAKRLLSCSLEQQQLAGLRQEVECFLDLFATSDREEGMNAFLQKRAPQFHSN